MQGEGMPEVPVDWELLRLPRDLGSACCALLSFAKDKDLCSQRPPLPHLTALGASRAGCLVPCICWVELSFSLCVC